MNDLLVVKLIETINAEIRLFHDLLNLLREEQAAIVADDLDAIDASVVQQRRLAAEAQLLEVERIQVVEELSNWLNMDRRIVVRKILTMSWPRLSTWLKLHFIVTGR